MIKNSLRQLFREAGMALAQAVLILAGLAVVSSHTFCDPWPDGCYFCNTTDAHCDSTNRSEVIPQQLDATLKLLIIAFGDSSGETVQLNRSMLSRYKQLEVFQLSGHISSVAVDALSDLKLLRDFNLLKTMIASVPDRLFSHNGQLHSVTLNFNYFEEIPLRAFTRETAASVQVLHFVGSNQEVNLPCPNNSLSFPDALEWFVNLTLFDISYNQFRSENCHTISPEIFQPVAGLKRLNISGTNLLAYEGGENILQALQQLDTLEINDLLPYKLCPARADKFFDKLPQSLQYLFMRQWETIDKPPEGCTFNNGTFNGLRKLGQLKFLGFDYSDLAFGPVLKEGILPDLERLETLDLTYCRISDIEEKALANLPRLTSLYLVGNPIGPKNYTLSPSTVMYKLSLARANILSTKPIHYDASEFICSYSKLGTLDLSNNLLEFMPRFTHYSSCGLPQSTYLRTLFLNNNTLSHFSSYQFGDEYNVCNTLTKLSSIRLDSNRIVHIGGLERCKELRYLNLAQNHLSFDSVNNMTVVERILRQLTKLEVLDISSNGISNFSSDVFATLTHLEQIFLGDNDFTQLPVGFFANNRELRTIDLSENSLTFVTAPMFKNLTKLSKLNLEGNLLSSIPQSFLHVIDSSGMYAIISDNPYSCDCSHEYFRHWLRSTKNVLPSDLKQIKCSSPTRPYNMADQLVYNYEIPHFYCYVRPWLIYGACVLLSVIIAVLVALPCYKYRWYLAHARMVLRALGERLQTTKFEYSCPYDAYVSFDSSSERDCLWVMEELVPAVERQLAGRDRPLRLYVDERDAAAGTGRYTERAEALQMSRKILVVLSNSYLRSTRCLAEADITAYEKHGRAFYQPDRVLVLITEDLTEEIIREPMTSILIGNVLQAKKNDSQARRNLWRRVRQFLARPNYVYVKDGDSRQIFEASSEERQPLLA